MDFCGSGVPGAHQDGGIKLRFGIENYLASSTAIQVEADAGGDNSLDPTEVGNNIFNPQNRSNSDDPACTPWIPPVIAGLTGFDIGLRVEDEADGDVLHLDARRRDRRADPGARD